MIKSSEEESWFGVYILNGMYRAQVCGVDSWWVLAEPYLGTAFSLGPCCTRAPDLAAQSRLENKQVVDRLSSPLKYQKAIDLSNAKPARGHKRGTMVNGSHRESQGWTTVCSGMPEHDGKDQGQDSRKQAGSCWFVRPC